MSYQGDWPMQYGVYATPIREVVDKRGEPTRYECSACGLRVQPLTKSCVCGVVLLGREVKRA